MNDRPKPPVVTSYGAFLRSETHRREVRIPRRDELPDNVAWIRDPTYGVDAPAVIGIAGWYAGAVVDKDGNAVDALTLPARRETP